MASISEQIAESLRKRIADGVYPLYSRLPPERELTAEFSVSRVTLRRALDVLEAERRIWRHVGKGTFVGSQAPAEAGASLWGEALATPHELLTASIVLEPAIAAQAALSATAADMMQLKHCLAKREAAADPAMYELWDIALHRAIAQSTHNNLLIALIEELNTLKQRPAWKAYRGGTMTVARRRESKLLHRAVVEAILAHDPQGAYEAMRSMTTTVARHIPLPAMAAAGLAETRDSR